MTPRMRLSCCALLAVFLSRIATFSASNLENVRLVDGNSSYEGRVEFWNGTDWGRACDKYFSWREAQVVCGHLNMSRDNAIPWGKSTFGEGEGLMLYNHLSCSQSSDELSDCSYAPPYKSCDHGRDAGVTCYDSAPPEFRLAGGPKAHKGRVEVRLNGGEWGGVCSLRSRWSQDVAKVLCKQLNLPSENAKSLRNNVRYGEGEGQMLYMRFLCNNPDTQNSLKDCYFAGGASACNQPNQTVAVVCK